MQLKHKNIKIRKTIAASLLCRYKVADLYGIISAYLHYNYSTFYLYFAIFLRIISMLLIYINFCPILIETFGNSFCWS